MISPELLRRYPFFGFLEDDQLKEVAMKAEEQAFEKGETIFQEGQPAGALYFLLEGDIDLYYTVEESFHSELKKEFPVGEINPGEPFGISACIEPYVLTSTARTTKACRVLKIEASILRQLMEADTQFAYTLMRRVAKAALERLHATRIQLAACWAK